MLTDITIDFDLAQILGSDFDPRRTKAYVTTNVESGTLMDTTTGETRLGDEAVTIASDGTGSFTTWATGVDGNPTSWQTSLVVDYPRTGQRDRKRRTFGPWTLTTADDGKNIVELEEEQAVPAEYVTQVTDELQTYSDAAAASAADAAASAALADSYIVADLNTSDGQMEALIESPTSLTSAALSATIGAAIDLGGVNGWKARNANGLPDLNATATTDRDTSATAELARYTTGTEEVLNDFTDLTGWTGVSATEMDFSDGTFRSAWDSGETTAGLVHAVTVLTTDTFRVSGQITVRATPATNSALWTGIHITHKTTPNTINYSDLLGVGVNERNEPIIYSAYSMSAATATQGAALAAGVYTATITVDENRVSLTLRNADGTVEYRQNVARTVLTGAGGTTGQVANVKLVNRDSRKTVGNSINDLVFKTDATRATVPADADTHYEHVYTYPTAISTDPLRVDVPPDYDPRVATPLVLFCHGSGRTSADIGNANTAELVRDLVADHGYLLAAPNMGGSSPWGNPASVATLLDAYTYARDHYHVGPVLLLGASAGCLTALTALAERDVPGVAGFYGMYGVTNLAYQYANNATHTTGIETAFGFVGSANYAAATDGYDPNLRPGWEFRGIPMRFSASYGDTTVDTTNNTDLFAAKVAPYSPEAEVVYGTGLHGDPSQTDVADVAAFFDRCLNRTA